jgi:hypothetical protein
MLSCRIDELNAAQIQMQTPKRSILQKSGAGHTPQKTGGPESAISAQKETITRKSNSDAMAQNGRLPN